MERILFLLPITYAGFVFGPIRGFFTLSIAASIMVPRAVFISPVPADALIETVAVLVTGGLVILWFESLEREKARRAEAIARLEVAQQELQSHIRTIEESQRRLSALNQTSSIVSQSLDLDQVLQGAVDNVVDVMQVDIAMIFILEEERKQLRLAAHRGVSAGFAQKLGWLRVGEGLNGEVAQKGEPLIIEDVSQDPRLARAARGENMRSNVIVPVKSKGRVVGTLALAMRSLRPFHPDEVELLSAIGNQIGVAVENASLYQQERKVAEQLRTSEERYRQLFENAHDAIWLHDLEGNIIAANRAWARLTGYESTDLKDMKAQSLFSDESRRTVTDVEESLVRGEVPGFLSEVELVRKDGTRAFVQLATSLVFSNDQPAAVQHIGRDVTEEKQMQENLRYFSQQAIRAQEEERKRIARELHDETLQALVVLSRRLDDLASRNRDAALQDALPLEDLRQQVDSLAQEIRHFSQDLRPSILDHLGLLPALEWMTSLLGTESRIVAETKVLGRQRRLPDEVELVLFRVVQEALRNVSRHSQATQVEVLVEFGEAETKVTVSDNGRGFAPPKTMGDLARDGKLGLAGMQERTRLIGGALTVHSVPGKGTTLTVVVPA